MIDGMIMDVPGIGKNRYETFEELELYCYRVAGTVGLMVLPILGTAEGVSEEDAKFPALSLGIALQLTNILRDVGEDAVRGRIYLPLEVCACVRARACVLVDFYLLEEVWCVLMIASFLLFIPNLGWMRTWL